MTTPDPRTARFEQIRTALNTAATRYPELAPAAKDLNDCAPSFTQAVQRLILGLSDGLGAASYDGGRAGGDNGSVPERMAVAGHRDPAADALADLDRMLRYMVENLRRPSVASNRLGTNARTVWQIVQAWKPRDPTAKNIRESVDRANDPEAECAHHRVFGTYEPVHRSTDGGGLLNHKTPLCRFCYDRLRSDGILPTADRMQRLQQGRTDRVRA